MSDWERRAHRAAGQAIGALLVGAPIDRVSLHDGAYIAWDKLPRFDSRSDDRILARIMVTLVGVGAQQRYSFGVPPGDAVWLMPRADQPTLMRDIEEVDATSIDLSDLSGLEGVWCYACEIITQEDVWEAIELVAKELQDGSLDGRQIALLCRAGGQPEDI